MHRLAIRAVLNLTDRGGYLSDALARHNKVFSPFYINMVKAGEAGGVLESVLERLADFLETLQDLRDYVKSALVYPTFLVIVGGIGFATARLGLVTAKSLVETNGGTIHVTSETGRVEALLRRSAGEGAFLKQ